MTPYTTPTPDALDTNELTQTIASQITHATHASLDPADAPTLGRWVRGSSTDDNDWRPTEARQGERPVGWVRVSTRKRGPVLVWCEGWTKTSRGYLASIMWPTEYRTMSHAELAAHLEHAIDDAASARQSGHGYASGNRMSGAWYQISRIKDEQRRRIVADIIRAGSRQEA